MLDHKGFDLWADGYDRAVGISDEENTYPFAGYKEVLGRIFRIVTGKPGAAVLDLGFGTGVLTAKLYEKGCAVYGQDFSARMIELARGKMPDAVLVQGDFSKGLAPDLRTRTYDFIVSTYALHHLDDVRKRSLIRELLRLLNPGGKLLIGDVSFRTRADLNACREEAGENWDGDEIYFVSDEMKEAFPAMEYEQISGCAGLMILSGAGTVSAPEELRLYIPRPEDGWFYVKMMSDPATMAYNAPWFPPDGCIPDPEAEWERLQAEWIGRQPERFYAFLQRVSDGAFVGDVNYHFNPDRGWHDMGIVIRASERGKGYGGLGLRLLADRAFRTDGVSRLHNDFETSRGAAFRVHKKAGFRETGTEAGIIHLELTREDYAGQTARQELSGQNRKESV